MKHSLFQQPLRPLTGAPISGAEARSLLKQARHIDKLEGMVVKGQLNLANDLALTHLPAGLCVDSLNLIGCTNLTALPHGLRARRINISGCTQLAELPSGLQCYELIAKHTSLRTLPADLRVDYRLDSFRHSLRSVRSCCGNVPH